MRKWVLALMIITVAASGALAQAHPIRKVLIAAVGKDGARASAIEAGLEGNLEDKGILATGLHTVYPSTVPVSQMLSELRSQGYDSLLCLEPRQTIRIKDARTMHEETHIESCLTPYVTGNYPTGDALEVNPLGDQPAMQNPTPNPSREPIPTNPRAGTVHVSKGVVRLFDIATGRLVWEKTVQVKFPESLHTDLQTKLIVHDVWEVLNKAGLFSQS